MSSSDIILWNMQLSVPVKGKKFSASEAQKSKNNKMAKILYILSVNRSITAHATARKKTRNPKPKKHQLRNDAVVLLAQPTGENRRAYDIVCIEHKIHKLARVFRKNYPKQGMHREFGKRWCLNDFHGEKDQIDQQNIKKQRSASRIIFGDLQKSSNLCFQLCFQWQFWKTKAQLVQQLWKELCHFLSKAGYCQRHGSWRKQHFWGNHHTTENKTGHYLISSTETEPERLVLLRLKAQENPEVLKSHEEFSQFIGENLVKMLKSMDWTAMSASKRFPNSWLNVTFVLNRRRRLVYQLCLIRWQPISTSFFCMDFHQLDKRPSENRTRDEPGLCLHGEE